MGFRSCRTIYIQVVQDFFHQQVWDCIVNVRVVLHVVSFSILFLGWVGMILGLRKPLDETHRCNHVRTAWTFFLRTWLFCCAGVVAAHLTFVLSQEDANAPVGANVLVSFVSLVSCNF